MNTRPLVAGIHPNNISLFVIFFKTADWFLSRFRAFILRRPRKGKRKIVVKIKIAFYES